jgi:hypothetical protein
MDTLGLRQTTVPGTAARSAEWSFSPVGEGSRTLRLGRREGCSVRTARTRRSPSFGLSRIVAPGIPSHCSPFGGSAFHAYSMARRIVWIDHG